MKLWILQCFLVIVVFVRVYFHDCSCSWWHTHILHRQWSVNDSVNYCTQVRWWFDEVSCTDFYFSTTTLCACSFVDCLFIYLFNATADYLSVILYMASAAEICIVQIQKQKVGQKAIDMYCIMYACFLFDCVEMMTFDELCMNFNMSTVLLSRSGNPKASFLNFFYHW